MENVSVNAKALRDVLSALNGPGHLIRELQVTRSSREPGKASLSDLTGVVNPIDQLIEQFNTQITRNSLIDDLQSRDAGEYKIISNLNGHFQFMEVFEPAQKGEVRLSELQMGWIGGAHATMAGTSVIIFRKVGKEPHYTLQLLEEDGPTINDEDVEFRLEKHHSIEIILQIEKPIQEWTDIALWRKLLEFFKIEFDSIDASRDEFLINGVQVKHCLRMSPGMHNGVSGCVDCGVRICFDADQKFLGVHISD